MSGQIEHLTLSSIIVSEGRRQLSEETVAGLVTSFKEVGLLNPITVWRPKDGQTTLVAGGHRLAAAHRIGWETVACYVIVADSIHAKIAELDENLVRSDLSTAERAELTYQRKELHEFKHPETKPTSAGGPGRAKETRRSFCDESKPADRFTKDVSKKTGRPERTVQLDAARGKALRSVIKDVIGTCLDKGDELDALAKLSQEKQRELVDAANDGKKVSAKTEIKKEKRAEKELDLAQKITELPDEKYGVILADPEWKFKVYSEETGMDRSADNHYPTSELEEIKSRDVRSIAADHCVLFLWATVPMLPQALEVMKEWGFEYKSHAAWVKDRIGTGYWFRNKHEILMVGTKGDVPAPAPGEQWASVIEAPVGPHSAKPETSLELIESYFPNLPKIELNRRGPPRDGWAGWGAECEEVDAAPSPDGQALIASDGGMATLSDLVDQTDELELFSYPEHKNGVSFEATPPEKLAALEGGPISSRDMIRLADNALQNIYEIAVQASLKLDDVRRVSFFEDIRLIVSNIEERMQALGREEEQVQ